MKEVMVKSFTFDKQIQHCSFIMAEARVVPLKPVTIPRMELNAATLAVRMHQLMKEEIELPLE